VWDKYSFDGIIAPVQSLPGLPHGQASVLTYMVVNLTGLQGLRILVHTRGQDYLVQYHRLSCWHRTHIERRPRYQQASSPASQADQNCSRSACTWTRIPTDVGDLICLLVRTIKIDSLYMSVLICSRIDHELAKSALSSSAQTQKILCFISKI
jgi:hypothetical protein